MKKKYKLKNVVCSERTPLWPINKRRDLGSVENWYPKCLYTVLGKTLLHLKVQRILTPCFSRQDSTVTQQAQNKRQRPFVFICGKRQNRASILFMNWLLKLHPKPCCPVLLMICSAVSMFPFWGQMHNFILMVIFLWSLEMCWASLQQTRKVKRCVVETYLCCLNGELI